MVDQLPTGSCSRDGQSVTIHCSSSHTRGEGIATDEKACGITGKGQAFECKYK